MADLWYLCDRCGCCFTVDAGEFDNLRRPKCPCPSCGEILLPDGWRSQRRHRR